MKSIRSRLTFWILGSLIILLIASGYGVYLSTQKSLLTALDAELTIDARMVRFTVRSEDKDALNQPRSGAARRILEQLPDYDETVSTNFFQKWSISGDIQEKSKSLGEFELSFPGKETPTSPIFTNSLLSDGRAIRTMQFKTTAGGKGKGKGKGKGPWNSGSSITVLAKEMTSVNDSLATLLAGLLVAGLIFILAAILIVHFALKHGLQPIEQLTNQSMQIDAESLDARFSSSNAPVELKPIYQHLNDLLQRLETSFERERRFSSDLAHEIRTPIAELKMINEVALKWPDQAGTDTHSESLEIADQVSEMIENLLNLARWESGEVAVKEEPVDLEALIRKCWQSLVQKAEDKKLNVTFNFSTPPTVFETDETMLLHIINNLLSNAAEYTPKEGNIKISTSDNQIVISNSTIGFSEANIDKIFDRYWRDDESRTDSSHSGLGLSLSKTCANALGLTMRAAHKNDEMTLLVQQ